MMNGGAISWSSKKQAVVAQSSAEAEYLALAHAAKELLWFKQFFISICLTLPAHVPLYCDNMSTINLSKNASQHAKTKHIDVRYHFLCHHVLHGDFTLPYCPTSIMAADIFTKALAHPKTFLFAMLMGLSKA
jgi:hypothetical protein